MSDKELFAAVRKGIEAKKAIGEASAEDRPDLQKTIDLGSEAETALFMKNKGLVHHIAKRFDVREDLKDDFIQEGYMALLESIKSGTFDPSKGTFATYAGKMIGWRFSSFMYAHIGSRLSGTAGVRKDASKALAKIQEYEEEHPSASEQEKADAAGIMLSSLLAYRDLMSSPVSLEQSNKNLENDGPRTILDTLGQEDDYAGLAEIDKGLFEADLAIAMRDLTPRQRTVVKAVHGLLGEEPKSFREIGRLIGKTQETARKDYKEAISILSRCEELTKWKEYL